MGVEAVRHELVAVELAGGFGQLAALADLGRHSALLQRRHALTPILGIICKARLAVVVQAIRVCLVAIELTRLLVDATATAFLAWHCGLLWSRCTRVKPETHWISGSSKMYGSQESPCSRIYCGEHLIICRNQTIVFPHKAIFAPLHGAFSFGARHIGWHHKLCSGHHSHQRWPCCDRTLSAACAGCSVCRA